MKTTSSIWKHWAWMLPILLLTNLLIAHHLTTDVYWFDELANLRKMGIPPYPPASLIDMLSKLGVTKWPPAYNFILLTWGNLVGWSEFATRTLSLFLGVLSVAMMYRLGKSLEGQRLGVIGACLLATSVFFLHYAHEIRGYIQYTFLTVAFLYLYWHYSQQLYVRGRDRLLFIVTGAILIYTHYVALYVVFGVGLYHLILAPRKNHWGKRLHWLILIGIAYLPWIWIAVLNALGETTTTRGLEAQIILETVFFAFSNGLWLIPLLSIGYAIIFVRDRKVVFLLFVASIFLIAALITNQLTDFLFHIRHIIGFLPFVILITALSISHLIKNTNRLLWGLVIVWMIIGVWLNQDLKFMDNLPGALPNRPLDLFTDVQDIIDTCIKEDDFLITHLASDQNIWNMHIEQYYWWEPSFPVAMIDSMVNYGNILPHEIVIDGTYEDRLTDYINSANRVWVTVASDAYETSRIEEISSYLASHYEYCGITQANGYGKTFVFQDETNISCAMSTVSTLDKCNSTMPITTSNTD